jgi:hypothetical protein
MKMCLFEILRFAFRNGGHQAVTKTTEFRDGEKVLYLSETGKLLGPFTLYLYDDGTPGLSYVDPRKGSLYPEDDGNHVRGIVGDRIITVGSPEYGRIDPRRIRHID